jgi:peptidoglycan/LPS O-acetylase OafA/YrhL
VTRASRIAIAVGGIVYAVSGGALLLAPHAFFEHAGHFPPYNRHYEGDAGAFLLPLGVALLLAARRPARHRLLLAFAAAASLLHALNHGYDALRGHESALNVALLLALAALLVAAALRAAPRTASK